MPLSLNEIKDRSDTKVLGSQRNLLDTWLDFKKEYEMAKEIYDKEK